MARLSVGQANHDALCFRRDVFSSLAPLQLSFFIYDDGRAAIKQNNKDGGSSATISCHVFLLLMSNAETV